jgi:NADH-quinone oxidoreductase subunit G
MSTNTEKRVTIEVNGASLEARAGEMLIEVTDRADIYVPRFCYHRKLSVAANCRMCLVDVEKAPKPLPACATPVVDGMKVSTRSERAISAQKATMEFLLINHPLDCPICDQGGECELQDLAMGFGRGVSRYTERKRVVKDKNLGPLISTDMTRCIHCTRCVRFGQEIAGIQELGAVGRSENMEIGTYVEKSIDHELSGNIIDLCPVGALNNKPYRFTARAWEMLAKPVVSPHDCAGSNLYAHVLRGRVRRVVPRDNEEINETWISDRDRFSCHGIEAPDRLERPMIKRDGKWQAVSWDTALSAARDALADSTAHEGDALGILVSPNATLEEHYLLRRIADRLGSRNIDHRLRRRDFSDQDHDAPWPWLGTSIVDIRSHRSMLVIGSHLRHEVPILAHHVRQAALGGTAVMFMNPEAYPYYFPVALNAPVPLEGLAAELAGVAAALVKATGRAGPADLAKVLEGVTPSGSQKTIAATLVDHAPGLVWLGHIAQRHPAYASVRALAAAISDLAGAKLGYLSEGANAAGAALAGALPHREPGGAPSDAVGFDACGMLSSPRHTYIVFGLEPDQDVADPRIAGQALKSADHVIAFTSFASASLEECATILLPIATFAETAGTFVNCEGKWQSFDAAAQSRGDSRPAWRVLRVLGNLLELPRCDYQTCEDIRVELESRIGNVLPDSGYAGDAKVSIDPVSITADVVGPGLYAVDPLVRRAEALQLTRIGQDESAPPARAKSA